MKRINIAIDILIIFFLFDRFYYSSAEEILVSTKEAFTELPSVQSASVGYPSGRQTAIDVLAGGMSGRISLDLRNIDVVDALKYFSMKSGINVITTKSVTGRVTLMVENVPMQDVFDIMLRSNSLAYDRKGDIYNVMNQAEYKLLYGEDFADVRDVAMFRLQYAIPAQAFNLFDMLKSEIGRVLVDQETGTVLIMDSPEKIKIMKEALKGFDEKNLVHIIKLNYANAKDVEEQLKTQLDLKNAGLIKADESGNQVIVQTFPERMKEIERLISILDRKTKEIIVDAQIMKVKLSDARTVGVEWEGLFDIGREAGLTYLGSYPFSAVQASTDVWASRKATYESVGYVGSYPALGTSTDYSAGNKGIATEEMHLGVIGKHDFDTIINYLQTIGDTKILSNPKLAVVNNQEAKIHVGEEIPYVISTTVGAGESTASVAEEVQFEEIGILLSVVPTINDEGYITLKVKSEVSSLLDYYITPTGNKIPIKDTSTAETTIMVKEGTTVIIGGLRKEHSIDSIKRVPFLGKIPILGKLFGNETRTKTITELMIVITPKIITGDVLVSTVDGKPVGEETIKSIRDYSDLKTEAFVPLDVTDKSIQTKGFKKRK